VWSLVFYLGFASWVCRSSHSLEWEWRRRRRACKGRDKHGSLRTPWLEKEREDESAEEEERVIYKKRNKEKQTKEGKSRSREDGAS